MSELSGEWAQVIHQYKQGVENTSVQAPPFEPLSRGGREHGEYQYFLSVLVK